MPKLRSIVVSVVLAVSQLAASPSGVLAQFGPPDTTTGPPKGATSFGIGVQVLDVADFNSALAANGFPRMSENAISTGLSTEIRFGRWEVAFSGSRIFGSDEENGTWRTRSSGSALTLGGGVAPYNGERWRIAALAGIGLTRISYHIEQVRGGTADSALADPLRGTDLDGQSWIWQAEVGIEHKLGKVFGQKMGVLARFGYAEAFGESDWRADDNDLASGPRASYGGMFARLGLTIGIPKRRDAAFPALFSVIPWLGR